VKWIFIAKVREIIVFIEVKPRNSLKFGEPELSVTKTKQSQIKKIAFAFLYEMELVDVQARFDVITILYSNRKLKKIKHFINAF